jgi:alcohol dehydrogenase (NADP+)
MKVITLNSGDKIPAVGLGTWTSTEAEMDAAINVAIDAGYRHIDCSPIYDNEVAIGNVLKSVFDKGKVRRDELWITSKLWNSFHLYDDVLPACKKTLKDLQLDYLDLFLIHWPVAFCPSTGFNAIPDCPTKIFSLDDAPLEQTWKAMEELVKQGLVKNIGVSNFSVTKLQHLLKHVSIKPVVNQVECHPYLAQVELNEFCLENEIYLTAYSPLGSGGRPEGLRYDDEPILLTHDILNNIATKYNKTPAQIVLAWLLQREVIVIPKSTNPARIQENLAAQDVTLTLEEIRELNALDIAHHYINPTFWELEGSSFKAHEIWK